MNATIKSTSSSQTESNPKSTNISVWVTNASTITVSLGSWVEDDNVLHQPIKLQPNERGQLNILSNAILAAEFEKLPPENEALYLGNNEAWDPVIQMIDDTDEIWYPFPIGNAAEILERVTQDYDYEVVIIQDQKGLNM